MPLIILIITLVLTFTPDGLFVTVQSDTPCHCYLQLDTQDGANLGGAAIAEFDLAPHELFGQHVIPHGPGSIRVRVWDGATDPSADQTFILPAHRVYLPLL